MPHKKNDSRDAEILVGDAIRRVGRRRGRSPLEAKHEERADQDRLQGQADAVLEVAAAPSLQIEPHRVGGALRRALAAIGPRREVLEDPGGAGFFLEHRRRPAREDAPPAHRVRHSGHAYRPDDGHVAHVRQRRRAVAVAALGGVLDRRQQVVHGPVEPLEERGRDAVRTGDDVDRRGAQLHPILALVLAEVGLGHRRADVEQRHAFAVHRYVDLFLEAHRQERRPAEQAAQRGVDHRRFEHVLAVGGEDVHHRQPAARPDRRARGVGHLRATVLDLEGGRGGAGLAIADRQPADLAGSAQVALHQLRREVLHVGDVVEAGADRVGGKVGAGVDVETDQVAHRGSVLGAIQPLERAPPRPRRRGGGGVHRRLERGDHGRDRHRVGTRGAGRRHHPGPELLDHLLGELPVLDVFGGVEASERQAAGLGAIAVAGGAVASDQVLLRVHSQRRGPMGDDGCRPASGGRGRAALGRWVTAGGGDRDEDDWQDLTHTHPSAYCPRAPK